MLSKGCYVIFNQFLVIGVLASQLLSSHAEADSINVAVASNFVPTLELVKKEFDQITGHQLNIMSGSSGGHYAQITNGAPFDLFLSADTARPAALERAGLITKDQRRIYALGRLALWSRDASLAADLQALQQLPTGQHLAIANPRLAPYGEAAIQALQYLGVYALIQDRIVMGENVGQAFQFAYSGSAMLSIVAYSQVLAAPVAGSHVLFPDSAYQPIEQEMVLLRSSVASRALFDFLSSDAMIPILEQSGYYSPLARPRVE